MKTTLQFAFACCFAAILLSMAVRQSNAQGVNARTSEFSANFGFSNLVGVDNNKHVNFGGAAGVNLSPNFSILGEYTYLPMGSVSASSGGSSATAKGSYQLIGAATRLNIGAKRTVPFILVDYGYARCTAGVGVSEVGVGSASASASVNGFYVGFGGGASLYLAKNWGVRPEFRWERQLYSISGTEANQNVIRGGASVFFKFGGKGKKQSAH